MITLLLASAALAVSRGHAQSVPTKYTLTEEAGDGNSLSFRVKRHTADRFYLMFSFTAVENAANPGHAVALVDRDGEIFRLEPSDPGQAVRAAYTTYFSIYPMVEQIDSTLVYRLPFEAGKTVTANATALEQSRHPVHGYPTISKGAFSFSVESGDLIFPVMDGIVTEFINKYDPQAENPSTHSKLTVEHPDGSIAEYRPKPHMRYFVKQGDRVSRRQPIGVIDDAGTGSKKLDFKISYRKITAKENGYGSQTVNINPVFATSAGQVSLEKDGSYTVTEDPSWK